jgi:hypothetical protein
VNVDSGQELQGTIDPRHATLHLPLYHPANPQMALQGLGLGVRFRYNVFEMQGKATGTTEPSTKYLSLSYALDMPQATFFCCAGTGLLSASDAAD